ncbi:MAG: molybdopterin-binding protein [Pseudomonadota bacterium]
MKNTQSVVERKKAAILAIGDELLSGRTKDANIHHLACWLTERGVTLREAQIVGDEQDAIVRSLNHLRATYDYVFTSGGIGPTHDDITVEAVAAAFNEPVIMHPKAEALVRGYYEKRGEEVTAARLRMARTPRSAELIFNPITGAPGIRVANVYVLAGVPSIFRAILDAIESDIEISEVIYAQAVTAHHLPESAIAETLAQLQSEHPDVAIGSYPIDGDELGVTVVVRSDDRPAAQTTVARVGEAMTAMGFSPIFEDRK